jgi:hypothetical protein
MEAHRQAKLKPAFSSEFCNTIVRIVPDWSRTYRSTSGELFSWPFEGDDRNFAGQVFILQLVAGRSLEWASHFR